MGSHGGSVVAFVLGPGAYPHTGNREDKASQDDGLIESELREFVQSSFKSIWALELLLFLKRSQDRSWTPDELVREMRGSAPVVEQSIEGLEAAGLVATDSDRRVQFTPASSDLRELCDAVQATYEERPDAVRRLILLAPNDKLHTLAEAFRLRKE